MNAVTSGFTSTIDKLNNYKQGGKSVKAGTKVLLPGAFLEKDRLTCHGMFKNCKGLTRRLLITYSYLI